MHGKRAHIDLNEISKTIGVFQIAKATGLSLT